MVGHRLAIQASGGLVAAAAAVAAAVVVAAVVVEAVVVPLVRREGVGGPKASPTLTCCDGSVMKKT